MIPDTVIWRHMTSNLFRYFVLKLAIVENHFSHKQVMGGKVLGFISMAFNVIYTFKIEFTLNKNITTPCLTIVRLKRLTFSFHSIQQFRFVIKLWFYIHNWFFDPRPITNISRLITGWDALVCELIIQYEYANVSVYISIKRRFDYFENDFFLSAMQRNWQWAPLLNVFNWIQWFIYR